MIIRSDLDSCKSKKINGVSQFLASESMQKERISRWKEFVSKHHDLLNAQFAKAAKGYRFCKTNKKRPVRFAENQIRGCSIRQ